MIFWCYTFAVFSALIVPFFPRAQELDNYSGSWTLGIVYVVACYFAFLVGYAIRYYATRMPATDFDYALEHSRRTAANQAELYPETSRLYLVLLAIWAMIGAGVIVLQIQMTLGFGAYMGMISGGSKAVEAARGATILVDASRGGLPGIVKVWNQNCTTSALILIFLLAEGHKFKGLISKFLVGVIGFCYVLRNFIAMDRLALLALVPAVYYLWKVSDWKLRKWLLILGGFVVALAQIQSMRRDSHNGALNYYILYVQSGMANANLMIDTLRGAHTYGFASLLSALYWLLKAIGLNVLSPDIQYSYLWNDAHNTYGLVFLDFDWWGPLAFVGAGALSQRMDRPPLYRGDRSDWKAHTRLRLRALLAFAALSTMFVPAYLGPEFPLTVVSLLIATWFEGRFPDVCFRKAKPRYRFAYGPQQAGREAAYPLYI